MIYLLPLKYLFTLKYITSNNWGWNPKKFFVCILASENVDIRVYSDKGCCQKFVGVCNMVSADENHDSRSRSIGCCKL